MPNSKIEKKFGVAALPWELQAKNTRNRHWVYLATIRNEVFLDKKL